MVAVFTNTPNPYNRHLYAAVRACGVGLLAQYKGDPASHGRPWIIPPGEGESISRNWLSDLSAMRKVRGSHVILSGGYIGFAEIVRRIVAPYVGDTLWFWGERLIPRELLFHYRRWYFQRFDGILAVGSWARASYRQFVGRHTAVHTLPYTTSALRPPRKPASHPVLGYAGSLIPRKGVDVVLRALASIGEGTRPRFEVVGSGGERQRLERLAADARLKVDWLGELTSQDLDERRATWWAQVVPSRYDGWGVVVSEAMASGVPAIVSSTVGAGRDLVRDGYNGSRVVHERSWPQAIARYSDVRIVEREGRHARAVGEELSAEKAAQWLLEVLQQGKAGPERSFVTEGWARVEARGL